MYLDDILIIAKTVEETLEKLEIVLKVLEEAGVTLNKNKCSFLQKGESRIGISGVKQCT